MSRIVAALLLVLAAGCGSTVSHDEAPAPPAPEAQAGPAVPGASPQPMAPSPATVTSRPPSGVIPAPVAPAPALSAPRPAALPPTDSSVPSGPRNEPSNEPIARGHGVGYDAVEIRLGLSYLEGANEAFSALGAGAIQVGDHRRMLEVMVEHLNATGGLAGRTVEPIWYAFDAYTDQNVQEQAACAAFTEDTTVFAAFGVRYGGGKDDTLTPCLAAADTIVLGQNGDERFFDAFARHLYSPPAMNETRVLRVLVDALAGQAFFDGAKLGLISRNTAAMTNAVDDGLRPALAARGIELVSEAQVQHAADPQGAANAVLQFRTAGVTHVLFAAPGGGSQVAFMRAADSQGYYPRYGLSSSDAPAAIQLLAPPTALKGAVGYGYAPAIDVDEGRQPEPTAAAQTCVQIFADAEMETSSALDRGFMGLFCDSARLLQETTASLANPTGADFQAVAEGAGPFATAVTFAAQLGPGRHDGASAYRNLAFVADCSCFDYTSDLIATAAEAS